MKGYPIFLSDHYAQHFAAMALAKGMPVERLLTDLLMDLADDDREAHGQSKIERRARR